MSSNKSTIKKNDRYACNSNYMTVPETKFKIVNMHVRNKKIFKQIFNYQLFLQLPFISMCASSKMLSIVAINEFTSSSNSLTLWVLLLLLRLILP